MLARGLGAVATASQQRGIWTPQRASSVALQRMLAMWDHVPHANSHRLFCALVGTELDEVLARYGIKPYFAGKTGAGLFTGTRASVLLRERWPLVRIRASEPGFCHYMHCITATSGVGGNTVYRLANGMPAARLSVNGGWLLVMGMPSGPTTLQLFANAAEMLPHFKGPGSEQWNQVLLPSVAYAGASGVGWLANARYSDQLTLAGAMQHFTLDIALPPQPEIIPAPVGGGDGPRPAVFNGPTLLVMVDMQYRIKWLFQYTAKDWEQFTL